MRTVTVYVPAPLGGEESVVESVPLPELAAEYDRRCRDRGIDPTDGRALERRTRMLTTAELIRLSTWGEVYPEEHAESDLLEAMRAVGH